jgi:hypothetical protein
MRLRIVGVSAKPLGRQDHTISPSASLPLVNSHKSVHRLPRPTSRDDREPSLCSEAGWVEDGSDLRKLQET